MKKLDENTPTRSTAITHEDLLALDDIRSKCLESSALIAAAADFSSPITPTIEVERLQALVFVAEKSATATFTAIEALIARIDVRRAALGQVNQRHQ